MMLGNEERLCFREQNTVSSTKDGDMNPCHKLSNSCVMGEKGLTASVSSNLHVVYLPIFSFSPGALCVVSREGRHEYATIVRLLFMKMKDGVEASSTKLHILIAGHLKPPRNL